MDLCPVPLIPMNFPFEFKDVYRDPFEHSPEERQRVAHSDEKLLIPGVDRRERIKADGNNSGGYAAVGVLRMNINGEFFTGSASLIADGSFILTCAHNLVEFDTTIVPPKLSVKAKHAWFEIRQNCIDRDRGSLLKNIYNVSVYWVHPEYSQHPVSESGFDIALCKIDVPDGDPVIQQIRENYGLLTPTFFSGASDIRQLAIVGYPAEKKGDKWGMVVDVPDDKKFEWLNGNSRQRDLLVYDFIDTSPGQSGCPIISNPGKIVGVHTGGKAALLKNWGTYVSPAKLHWINKVLGVDIQ